MSLLAGYEWLPRPTTEEIWAGNSKDNVLTFWLCSALAGVLALPPVSHALGLDPWIACSLVLSFGIRSLLLVPANKWLRNRPYLWRAILFVQLVHGVAVVDGLVLATHDPHTALWSLAVMYATFDGTDFDHPPLASYLALHVGGALGTIPLFLAMEVSTASAVGIPVFIAAVVFSCVSLLRYSQDRGASSTRRARCVARRSSGQARRTRARAAPAAAVVVDRVPSARCRLRRQSRDRRS